MLEISSTLSGHVRFLLQGLDDSNADSVFRELCQLTEYGTEGSIVVVKTCLDYLNSHNGDLTSSALERVVISAVKYTMNKPNFGTILCEALNETDITEEFLENLSKTLHLSVSEKIGIGLALSDSENTGRRMCGKNFSMAQIEELIVNPIPMDSSEQIHNILMFLHCSEGLSKHVDSFMQMVSLVQAKDVADFVLAPLLSDDLRETNILRSMDLLQEHGDNDFDAILEEMEKEMSMGDIIKELGYGCTVDAGRCKEILSLCLPLTEMTIARILGTIARTHSGLEDNQSTFPTFCLALGYNASSDLPSLSSWNADILIKTIKQLAPSTNWVTVMENLDHEGFYIPNEAAFSFFMTAYGFASQEPFPLHAICCSPWKNSEGQLSFLRYAVSASPEIFSFAHSARQLAYTDAVDGHNLQAVHANHAWLCLDLLELLCQLAERGHASSVRQMLEYPLKHCPEILLLGMAHINTAYNLLQHDVASSVFPLMIKNASGAGMILHIWHVNHDLLLRGFLEVHNSEPDSMIKIVEICQELKILISVLEMVPFAFGIRLAVLASQKEAFDLEKWLSSNLNTHKDIFFGECIRFLREAQSGGSQDFSAKRFHSAVLHLYLESSSTLFKVLKAHTTLIDSAQLIEDMERLHATILDSDPKLQNGGTSDSSASDGYGDDIEAEANSYFQQIFSGQLTMDAMVQMLARFKESSVKREQLILECMIANLFEEYRFFPKYPERQLKIAVVIFGSVIKHQLVTHLTLGIALRGVLDALRKPADSKMFLFGTKALEQFVDHLIEWPQYCNHILQISHLRATHAELVAFIERALARISSGHLESDAANNPPPVQHHVFSQATSRNGEAPASEVQDKISFIINNISAANIEAKAKEFTEILKEQYYPWFAQYMVMKRLEGRINVFEGRINTF